MRRTLGLITVALLSACQTPQRSMSESELIERYDGFAAAYDAELQEAEERSQLRIESEYRNAHPEKQQSYDVLVLSGGGAFGAFGAGFLLGWGSVEDREYARPQFDSVSGISTGALIAPYAFVGTPDAYETIVDFYRNPGENWVKRRGIIPYLPGNVSVFDVSRLHEQIESAITPELVRMIASGAKEDRMLLIGATNVDYGLLRVWDIARAAEEAPLSESTSLAVTALQASSAIPGAFPPILINDLMYVDGGAAMQVVGTASDRNWAYSVGGDSTLSFVREDAPIRIRVWMIVNQKLLPEPKVVASRWTSVATSSLDSLIKTSTLQSIQDAESYVRLIDQQPYIDAKMHYVSIPQDYEIGKRDGMFDADIMRDLVELGQRMGADPDSWKSKALLPAAPFKTQ